MTRFSSFVLLLIYTIIFIAKTEAQNQLNSVKTNMVRKADIDTLSNIKINKLVFYQHPLCFENDSLKDLTSYVPDWYKAYYATFNSEKFEFRIDELLGLFHSTKGITKELAIDNMKEIKKSGPSKYQLMFPYQYFFGEIWLTYLKTGEQMVLVMNYRTKNKIPALEFNQPIKKMNRMNEKIDSLTMKSNTMNVYIYEDGRLKYADYQYGMKQLICRNSSYMTISGLHDFKDVLFRAHTYIRSVIMDGKRVFETIENTPNGTLVKSVSDIP